MYKLYGFALSNYYNAVKLMLLEKGLAFEEIATRPSQEDAFCARSPMGKVPCLDTPQGPLSETSVIMAYLEEAHPAPALMPADPFARAKARELFKVLELYLELPGRRHYGEVFFGGPRNEAALEEVRTTMERGIRSLKQLASFSPWACGEQMTCVDLFLPYALTYPNLATQAVYGWDFIAEVPGLQATLDKVAALPNAAIVNETQQAAMAALQAGG